MLILTRRKDESIHLGDNIVISVVDIKGDQVKLGIQAPSDVKVYRHEVWKAINDENRRASEAPRDLKLPPLSIRPSGD